MAASVLSSENIHADGVHPENLRVLYGAQRFTLSTDEEVEHPKVHFLLKIFILLGMSLMTLRAAWRSDVRSKRRSPSNRGFVSLGSPDT
jgi:hypothetical protein